MCVCVCAGGWPCCDPPVFLGVTGWFNDCWVSLLLLSHIAPAILRRRRRLALVRSRRLTRHAAAAHWLAGLRHFNTVSWKCRSRFKSLGLHVNKHLVKCAAWTKLHLDISELWHPLKLYKHIITSNWDFYWNVVISLTILTHHSLKYENCEHLQVTILSQYDQAETW